MISLCSPKCPFRNSPNVVFTGWATGGSFLVVVTDH